MSKFVEFDGDFNKRIKKEVILMSKFVEFDGDFNKRIKKLELATQKEKGYEVGFFQSSTYDDGTKVAAVASDNEFGVPAKHIPERPFFRIANKKVEKKINKLLESFLKYSENYILSASDINKLGLQHEGEIKKSIIDLKEPPNKPETIRMKKGKTNPLINTGLMLRSTTFKRLK